MIRKLLLVAIMMLILPAIHTEAQIPGVNLNDPIDRIALFSARLASEGATIDQWSVYARQQNEEQIDKSKFDQIIEAAKKNFSDYTWHSLKKSGGIIGWQGNKAVKSGYKMELTYFAIPSDGAYRIDTIYQASGPTFNKWLWSGQSRQIREEITKVFQEQVHIFSCVRAHDSDKMNVGLLKAGERYLQPFSAVPIERLKEKTFVSISAYTGIWNDSIYSGNRKMNIQVALRNDGNRTVITLGTPIITLEY